MAADRWTIEGRSFKSKMEFDAANRDLTKINKIRKEKNLKNPDEVKQLLDDIQHGVYYFESIIGRDFDDEMFELYEKIKHQAPVKNNKKSSIKNSTVKNSKTSKQNTNNKSGQSVSLDDFDEEMKNEILLHLKKIEKRRKWIIRVCSLVAIVGIGYFSAYYYFVGKNEEEYSSLASLIQEEGDTKTSTNAIIVNKTTKEIVIPNVLEKYKTLYNKNKSLIGWIKIDDTIIDYPVMQSADAEYYLNHDFEQNYDKNGSIFIDPACNVLDRSDNLIIYGHHMQSGKMFASLEKYSDEEYYKKHPMIQFDTIYEEGTYQIMYVFRSRIYNADEVVFKYYQFIDAISDVEFQSNMEEMAGMSLYDTGIQAQFGDQLITLSTCDYEEPNGRFVVVAKRVK